MKKLLSILILCFALLLVSCAGTDANSDGKESESGSFLITESLSVQSESGDTEAQAETSAETGAGTTETVAAEGTSAVTTEPKETIELKIGSYNIKHAADGGCETIGKVIASAGLDIVGLQEVDHLNTRSASLNQTKLIAEAAGMPYYQFIKAIDYKGGQYGTAILSKYPIESYTIKTLYSGSEEGRSVGHAVIDVDGVRLDFFNTHLSYESADLRKQQFVTLSKLLAECDNFVLTGDFNTQDFTEFAALGDVDMVNSSVHRHVTFPGSSSAIDNVISSKNLCAEFLSVITDSHSDHYALTAVVYLK